MDVKFYITTKCNAHCAFCFAEKRKDKMVFMKDIDRLIDLAENNRGLTLNMTGGEPGLYMDRVAELLNYSNLFSKTIVTTNYTFIKKLKHDNIQNYSNLDYINLSLHSLDNDGETFTTNEKITGIKIPVKKLKKKIEMIHSKTPTKISLQMVFGEIPTLLTLQNIAEQAYQIGFDNIRVRLDYNRFPDLKLSIKKTWEVYGEDLVNVSSCDACYSAELKPEAVLNIMPVSIHLGVMEPSEHIPDFEYIINDGVFRDYERKKVVVLPNPPTEITTSRYYDNPSSYGSSSSSCGGSSSSSSSCGGSSSSSSSCGGSSRGGC